LDRFSHNEAELKENSLNAARAKPPISMTETLSKHALKILTKISDYNSVADVNKIQLQKLAHDPNVSSIVEYSPEKTQNSFTLILPTLFGQTQQDNLNTLSRSAYDHNQNPLPVNLANSIHAATFESGLDPNYLACLGVSPAYYDRMSFPFTVPSGFLSPTDSIHTLATFTLLAYSAPGAKLYHYRSWSYTNPNSQEFLIDNSINTMSMSTSSAETQVGGPNNLAIDDFAFRYPYPTFSLPTGNAGYTLRAQGGAYNALIVGNVQDSAWIKFLIDTATCNQGTTMTKNLVPINSECINIGGDCAGDREVPYIIAPGFAPNGGVTPACTIYGRFMGNNCGIRDQSWGTSQSAPVMNGMVANLLGQKSFLVNQPEGTRAIFLLTAKNVTNGYWDSHYDGKDGAGVVHGLGAINFAKSMTTVTPSGVRALNGYWFGSFGSNNFPPTASEKTFNIQIPTTFPSGMHLRIVFTWDSMPDLNAQTDLLSDLDLQFVGPKGSKFSSSWDSNIETIDVLPSELTAGGTCQVKIMPYIWRRPSGARTTTIHGALAWTFVSNHAH
jgi:hypothetical protein